MLPLVPLATVKVELAYRVTGATYVVAAAALVDVLDMLEMPIAEPTPVFVPIEILRPSDAVSVTPLPLLLAVTPVSPVLVLITLTTSAIVELLVKFAVIDWPFK